MKKITILLIAFLPILYCQQQEEKVKELTKEAQFNTLPTLMGHISKLANEKGHAATITSCRADLEKIQKAKSGSLKQLLSDKYDLKSFRAYRTSLKIRNPENAPGTIEKKVLQGWQEQELAGSLAKLTVKKQGQKWYGFAPIRVESPLCLGCHGDQGNRAKGVDTELKKRYPQDEATGYKLGDLRGAFVVQAEFNH